LQADINEKGRKENRTVPSAGKRYPLEIYLFLFRDIDGCRQGIYHYGVKNHALEPVVFEKFSQEDILSFSPYEWLKDTNGMICITSIFDRMINKYGSRGYRYILLEAGHVAQNMLLAGTEDGINIIPIGAVNEEEVEKKIGLNTGDERVIYTLFF
jgi:SagB-type dehydrogenase family enzyme